METNASTQVEFLDIQLLEDAISVVQKSLDRLYRTRQRLEDLRKDITAMVESWNEVFDSLEID